MRLRLRRGASASSWRDGFRALASEAEVREALEKAFDYRGDVTITRKDGSRVEDISSTGGRGRRLRIRMCA